MGCATEPLLHLAAARDGATVPFPQSHAVVHFDRYDHWRTWFIEECDTEKLFGLTERHLISVKGLYSVGTRLFLEDQTEL